MCLDCDGIGEMGMYEGKMKSSNWMWKKASVRARAICKKAGRECVKESDEQEEKKKKKNPIMIM